MIPPAYSPLDIGRQMITIDVGSGFSPADSEVNQMASVVKCNRCGLDSGLGWAVSRRTGKHYIVWLGDDGQPKPGLLHRCSGPGQHESRDQAVTQALAYQAERAAARLVGSAPVATQTAQAEPVKATKATKAKAIKATAEPVKPEVKSVPIGSQPGPMEAAAVRLQLLLSAGIPAMAAQLMADKMTDDEAVAFAVKVSAS